MTENEKVKIKEILKDKQKLKGKQIEEKILTTGNPWESKMSVWHKLARSILILASPSLGGSTCISSTLTTSPTPQHTAAVTSSI